MNGNRKPHAFSTSLRKIFKIFGVVIPLAVALTQTGCGSLTVPPEERLLSVPITFSDPAGDQVTQSAIIDTGGAFEVLLRERFGFAAAGRVSVLAFGGRETLEVTEPFDYCANGVSNRTHHAIVGLSACNCNGLGYLFFRETGVVLGLDLSRNQVAFLTESPTSGATIVFETPPPGLDDFETSFIEVQIGSGTDLPAADASTVIALLDTGATLTVVRCGVVIDDSGPLNNRVGMTITHPSLGTVAVRAGLFDTPDIPDLILGLDVMRAWSDRWYFTFTPRGGFVVVEDRDNPGPWPTSQFNHEPGCARSPVSEIGLADRLEPGN